MDDLEAKRERDAEFTGETYASKFVGCTKHPAVMKKLTNKICVEKLQARLPKLCCCTQNQSIPS
jgi:type I restriction enzyme M protein